MNLDRSFLRRGVLAATLGTLAVASAGCAAPPTPASWPKKKP